MATPSNTAPTPEPLPTVLPPIGHKPPVTNAPKSRPHWFKRRGATLFSAIVFLVAFVALSALLWAPVGLWALPWAALFGVLCMASVHMAYEWERVVILRLGNYSRVASGGIYFTIPIFEQVALHVDQRIRTTTFLNEHALTSDLAPVNVDAVVFWMVWGAKEAYTQVEDFPNAVSWAAQTALRDAIGKINLTDVPMKRKQMDHEVQEHLEQKLSDWGISIISVEIRDIVLPEDLQNAMSRAAQAERERDARIILAESEKESSHMFVEAAEAYKDNETALQLRIANLLYEGVRGSGSMVVVPSTFADSVAAIETAAKVKGLAETVRNQ